MTLSQTHTKAATQQQHPFLLLFRVSEWQLWSAEGGKGTKTWTQWLPIHFFPCPEAKNYTIMSFSWCAHQQEWKPHLSSFGVIENQSLGNSVELSASFAVKKRSWRKSDKSMGGRWELLGSDTQPGDRWPWRGGPFLSIPIQFAAAVNQALVRPEYKYATYNLQIQ